MKAVVAAFNQEKALVGAFSVITNIRMELFQAQVCTIVRVFVRSRAGDWQQHPGHGRGLSRLDGPRPQQEILGLHSTQLTNKSQLIPNYSLFNSLIKSGLKHLLDIQNNKLGVRFIGNILSISAFLLIFI